MSKIHPINQKHPNLNYFKNFTIDLCKKKGWDNASIEQVWLFLTEEFGELAGSIRRSQNHFRDDRRIKLEDELGDVFSYLFQISGMLNIDLNVMWSKNIQKVHQKIYN